MRLTGRATPPAILIAVLIAAPAAFSGCLSPQAASSDARGSAPTPDPGLYAAAALAFAEPTVLTPEGHHGYEPSIATGPEGTLYVTAHKGRPTNEATRLASWLWTSGDGGASWHDVASPLDAHEQLYGWEGDVAVDAVGRLYFVDMYFGDSTLSRWRPTSEGPAWEWTRPVHGTVGADDRPWLTAHGDGVVYYVGHSGTPWLLTSEDGGLTWTPGRTLPGEDRCTPAASPADDRTVHLACWEHRVTGEPVGVTVYSSNDRGATWRRTEVATYRDTPGAFHPTMAVDREGNAYRVWLDGFFNDHRPDTLGLARSLDGGDTWSTHNLTPFRGSLAMAWACAGDAGTLGVVFYATEDAPPTNESQWYAYALVTANATADEPGWTLALVDAAPVAQRSAPPQDFFQCAVGPDNALHVAYDRVAFKGPNDLAEDPTGRMAHVMYTRQTTGPNLPAGEAP